MVNKKQNIIIGIIFVLVSTLGIIAVKADYTGCDSLANCCTCSGTRDCATSFYQEPSKPNSCHTGINYDLGDVDGYHQYTYDHDNDPSTPEIDHWCKGWDNYHYYTWETCCRWPSYHGSTYTSSFLKRGIDRIPFEVNRPPHSAVCPGVSSYCSGYIGGAYTKTCCAGCCDSCLHVDAKYDSNGNLIHGSYNTCISTTNKDLYPKYSPVRYYAYTDYTVSKIPSSYGSRGCGMNHIVTDANCGENYARWSFDGCVVPWLTKCQRHDKTNSWNAGTTCP